MGKPAIVKPGDPGQAVDIAAVERIRQQVADDLTEFAAIDQSFVLYGQPALMAFPGILQPLNILNFTVPPGRTLEIDRIDFWISEPYLYGNGQFGWRATVDGGQLPFWQSQTGFNRPDYLTLPLAQTPGNEPRFSPIYLYANSVLAIEIVELVNAGTAFNANVWVAAYVYGTLRKPTGATI